jgi:hypothetical protein
MTVTLCVIAVITMLLTMVLVSREVTGLTPLRVHWGLHALSIGLIFLAVSTRGIWYHADLYLGDIWTAQDALVKISQGTRSNFDYFNPIGPAWEWVLALTLLFREPSAGSFVLANVFAATLSLAFTIVLLRKRASPITVAVVGLFSVTTALSPRDIDSLVTASQSSLLAPYNRWGWALLLPVAMRAALPGGRPEWFSSAATGLAIGLLLLLKITYGLAAIGIFLVVAVLESSRWREIGAVAVSVLISIGLMDLASGGQIRAYLGDIVLAGQMSGNGLRLPKLLALLPTFGAYALGCVLLTSAARLRNDPSSRWWADWRVLIAALAVGGSGVVVLMQNHYWTEAVTLWLMPLIVAERGGIFTKIAGVPRGVWTRQAEWIGAIALVTLAMPAIDAGFILAQKVQLQRKSYLAAPFQDTAFEGLAIDERYQPVRDRKCIERTCFDMRRLASGAKLLARYCPAYRTSAVLAFNFSNPFPALLNSASPRHMPIWLHPERSFSRNVHTPGRILFSDVSCVIVALDDTVAAALEDIYGQELRQSFDPVANDGNWQLWARRQAASPVAIGTRL